MNKTELKLHVNESEKLIAAFVPDNATDKALTWSSSDEKVAIVDENGLVTAKGLGTAEITVTTEDGKTAVCKVTVEKKKDENPSTKPDKPNQPDKPQKPESPKTADNSNVFFYMIMLLAAGAGIIVYAKRRRNWIK